MSADHPDGFHGWRRDAPVVEELPRADPDLSPARRLAIAFELFDVAGRIRAQRHLREQPQAEAAEVDEVVRRWRAERPGAPLGDAEGRVRARSS